MKKRLGPEATIQSEFLTFLRGIPGMRFNRRAVDHRGRVKSGETGEADVQGVWKGQAWAVELKAGKNTLSEAQEVWRDRFIASGGMYCCAWSFEAASGFIRGLIRGVR